MLKPTFFIPASICASLRTLDLPSDLLAAVERGERAGASELELRLLALRLKGARNYEHAYQLLHVVLEVQQHQLASAQEKLTEAQRALEALVEEKTRASAEALYEKRREQFSLYTGAVGLLLLAKLDPLEVIQHDQIAQTAIAFTITLENQLRALFAAQYSSEEKRDPASDDLATAQPIPRPNEEGAP